jgi:hypothetical protein
MFVSLLFGTCDPTNILMGHPAVVVGLGVPTWEHKKKSKTQWPRKRAAKDERKHA